MDARERRGIARAGDAPGALGNDAGGESVNHKHGRGDPRLVRARELIELGRPGEAASLLDACLAGPKRGEPLAWLLRAEARRLLGDAPAAEADHQAVLARAPDLPVEHWQAWVRGLARLPAPAAWWAPAGPLAQALDAAVEGDPDQPALYRARGERLRARGMLESALSEFVYAAEIDDDDLEAWLGQADCALALGQLDIVVDALDRAVDLDPNNIDLFVRLAEARLAYGDASGAIAACEEGMELAPEHVDLRLCRARAALALDLPADAVEDCRAALLRAPRRLAALLMLAQGLFQTGDDDAALEAVERVVARVPGHVPALRLRGAVRAAQGDIAAAESDFERVLALAPGDLDAQLSLVETRLARGDRDGALAAARDLVDRHPDRPDTWLVAADAQAAFDDPTAVRDLLDRGIERHPDVPDLYAERAEWLLGAGLRFQAWRDARWAIELDPDDAEAHVLAARVAIEVGATAEALADLDLALEAVPEHGGALAWRGRALALDGDREAAEASWAQAETVLPADDPLRDAIATWRRQARRR